MSEHHGIWELMILDGKAASSDLYCLAAADIDGDGNQEIITGGNGALLWYRPGTYEKGVIETGNFSVGIALKDVDGDGKPEVFIGEGLPHTGYKLYWYKPGCDLNDLWERHVIDPVYGGHAHDILFADLDGDGENELVAVACNPNPGIYAFKRGSDITAPWAKHVIQEGIFTEGLSVGDLDGDGRLEVVCGPDWYTQPAGGAFFGRWARKTYAPNYREMCRTAMIDITGNGRPDLVITDSEYMDGSISWFENRLVEHPENPWVEHRLEDGLIYSHSLDVVSGNGTGESLIFVAEMDAGGWHAPYNLDARLITYTTKDHGKTWQREELYKGEGSHQAILYDIDGDGELEVVGKTCSQDNANPKVQIWKRKDKPALDVLFKHRFLDRDKPDRTIDIMAADVDGDGRPDVLCGAYWYHNSDWQRFTIPGIFQVINHYDLDGDGREEFIALKRDQRYPNDDYKGLLSGELWWVKPIDPVGGKWEEHRVGAIDGDWPHGSLIAPVLPGGGLALIACYHNSLMEGKRPELFRVPADPTVTPWEKQTFADVLYNEELLACDIDRDGSLDIIGGTHWFDNLGDGSFAAHPIDDNKAARVVAMDVNSDGWMDAVVAQEEMDYPNRRMPFSQLIWLENPGETGQPWKRHVIDELRCAHSLGAADIDGDGEVEIIAAEHDPFWPYRKRCRLMAYKKADKKGTVWYRTLIDGRFEHHDGAKIFEISPGRIGIISHGWEDKLYTHLWEVVPRGEVR